MTLQECARQAQKSLEGKYGLRQGRWMVLGIFEHLLGYNQVDMAVRGDTAVSAYVEGKVATMVDRLLADEPLQYITSTAHFCGHRLKVTPATLIPRPETEELADMIIKENREASDLRVLDMGTGSGCLAVTLARALKFATIDAIDISQQALEVAAENAARLKVRVNFLQADIMDMEAAAEEYDLIVSNPPYVTLKERQQMQANVLEHEPALALFVPDDDPLKFYTAIGAYAAAALKPAGKLYLEANPPYVRQLCALLADKGLTGVESRPDMQGRQRFVKARRPD